MMLSFGDAWHTVVVWHCGIIHAWTSNAFLLDDEDVPAESQLCVGDSTV